MKTVYKKILKIIGIILGIFVLIFLTMASWSAWNGYKWQRAAERFEEAMKKPYKEDIYGGETPEETWQMFLDALKKEDIDLASKYFAVEKQEEWKKTIKNTIEASKLDMVIKNLSVDLKKEENYLQNNRAYYYYELRDDKTGKTYNNSVVFYLNFYTKVWKILVL